MPAPNERILKNWQYESGLANLTRFRFSDDDDEHFIAFTPELAPISMHREVTRRHLEKEVLKFHLLDYLTFTVHLEHTCVNRVLQRVVCSEFPMFSCSDRLVAHRILCDESYHALISADFSSDVAKRLGLNSEEESEILREHGLRAVLDRLKSEFPQEFELSIEFLFAVVSETLITGTLVRAPKDPRVAPSVRKMLLHHAEDEAMHHSFFSRLFCNYWDCLPGSHKNDLESVFPRLIRIFLDVRPESHVKNLVRLGLSESTASRIMSESYRPEGQIDRTRKAAQATLALLRRKGIDCRAAEITASREFTP
jgi:hypothetical protein